MHQIQFELIKKSKISHLPISWNTEDYKALLTILDFEADANSSEKEIKELCFLALSDMEPPEASEIVLTYLLADYLTEGQIKQMGHDMLEDKLWEEYPEMSLHASLYKANILLYEAYNGKFPRNEAITLVLKIMGLNPEEKKEILSANPQLLVQILAAGMDDHGLLKRLFGDGLEAGFIEEAEHIIWHTVISDNGGDVTAEITSSSYWLEDFESDEGSCSLILTEETEE